MDPSHEPLQIAIDGPAGSGKSSVAAALAEALDLVHVDTGAMYRALTLVAERESLSLQDGPGLALRLERMELSFRDGRLHLDGEDVSAAIREEGVTARVSELSAHAEVRAGMVRIQRRLCRSSERGAVLEGRDIGSVVLPLSRCKIYLDAEPTERARRRLLQLGRTPELSTLTAMREEIERRDKLDAEREHSPLQISPDAHVLDTTGMDLEEVVGRIGELVEHSVPPRPSDDQLKPYEVFHWYYPAVQTLIRTAFYGPCGMKIYGRDNARIAEPLLFAANHISEFDPPLAGCATYRNLHFLAKRELFVGPFGWLIGLFGAIPIRRGRFDPVAFDAAKAALRGGDSLMFFPEGTRKPAGHPGPGKRGLGILWMETQVAMIPVFVRGTDRLRAALLRKERLEVWLGPPLRLHALEVLQRTMADSAIQQRIGRLWLACIRELAERSEEAGARA
jgi:cytidylate kinase